MWFQILIVLFSLFAVVSLFVRKSDKALSIRSTAFWILFWIGVDVIVLFPDSTTVVANALGIGRGTDLVLYVAMIAVFLALFRLNLKMESLGRDITKLVRRDTLEEARKK